jgi:L-ascorbate metabolism protein UlaG (beta-lactamase superfamily)
LESVDRIYVLMVPIDETNHLLTYEEVDQVVGCLAPTVLIPIHYFVPGLTDPASPLGELEGWLAEQSNIRRVNTRYLEVASSDLPQQSEVWVFESIAHTIAAF